MRVMNKVASASPQVSSASLEEPLYYLYNIDTVIAWVRHHYDDIFSPEEQHLLDTIQQLDTACRATLCRLIMRRGEWFRDDKLSYAEIGAIHAPLQTLAEHNLIHYPAACRLTELITLCRVAELQQLWTIHGEGTAPKGKDALLLQLSALDHGIPRPLNEWWPNAPFKLISLRCQAIFELLKMLFFGNAQQDWSEFVLTELGHQRYEQVDLDDQHRAFANRAELDAFSTICGLAEAHYLNLLSPDQVLEHLPDKLAQPWLEYRRQKLLYSAAHAIERLGRSEEALALYRCCSYREAKIRQLRLMEKIRPCAVVARYAGWLNQRAARADWREAAEKVWHRSARKAGQSLAKRQRYSPQLQHITLDKPNYSVERASREHFHSEEQPCYYVENALLPGLFALTFWEAFYAPVPGAFFNPFQRRPADLYQEDFSAQRSEIIAAAWQSMQQPDYSQRLLARYRDKAGIANPFTIWGLLSESLLEQALQCIPVAHLSAVFERMFNDLRQHSSGFPDLIQFDLAAGTYQLIEIKGPGDRLQDHQQRWLAYFEQHGIPAVVCHVRWRQA